MLPLLLLDNKLGMTPIPGTKFFPVDGPREAVLWSRAYSVLGVHYSSKGLVQQIRRPTDVYCCCCCISAAGAAALAATSSAEVGNIGAAEGA